MPVPIEKDAFIQVARAYVHHLLEGLCEDDFLLAVDPKPHTVRIVAKLSAIDFDAIKFSDLYLSAQKLVGRLGIRHLDPATNDPHNAEFKLYDPYFENLDFHGPE
jgi:hypothetical protein